MLATPLQELLKLPASDRAELAMALWESLTDEEREGELQLTDEQRADLDGRWTEHIGNPRAAVAWSSTGSSAIGFERRRASGEDEREQAMIRKRALQVVGSVAGDDPYRAERARELVRQKLGVKSAPSPPYGEEGF